MLIRASGAKPYIILANTKAASTSLHGCPEITKDCEFRIWSSRLGKHLGLKQIERRYSFLFEIQPFETFDIVMVIREPMEWYLSWYRYRQGPNLREHPRTSFGMDPETFFFDVFSKETISQSMLLNKPGMCNNLWLIRLGPNFRSDFERDKAYLEWDKVAEIPHLNKSNTTEHDAFEINDEFKAAFQKRFEKDLELWAFAHAQQRLA